MDITQFTLNPVTLLAIVFGMVEFVKSLGLEGNKLRLISMGLGILLAVGFQAGTLFPAASPFIEIIFFGLAVGLAACGVFSFINSRFPTKEG